MHEQLIVTRVDVIRHGSDKVLVTASRGWEIQRVQFVALEGQYNVNDQVTATVEGKDASIG